MGLKELTLASLGETNLNSLFQEAKAYVENSLETDKDVKGKRSITIELAFEPNERGYIEVDMAVKWKTPTRSVMSIAALEGSTLRIDTVSNDAQQPDLLDPENIIDFNKKKAEGRT